MGSSGFAGCTAGQGERFGGDPAIDTGRSRTEGTGTAFYRSIWNEIHSGDPNFESGYVFGLVGKGRMGSG